ncbi:MAG: 2,3-bisphosphoglycerate-independent phosphoglycerate mutase [Lachnospirales bacterium]
MKKTTMLLVLDGYGLNQNHEYNAIYQANTPVMDRLLKEYPNSIGQASGLNVGLPDGQMGNSEVGHLNIGAGRIVYQELTRITKSIDDGDFFKEEKLLKAINNAKENGSNLHLLGLLSDGGVHSHNTHLYGLLELCKRENFQDVYVHAFLDGRDTPPTSAKGFLHDLEEKISEIGVGKIASISGRFYAMDRDNRWERVETAYKCLVDGVGEKAKSSEDAIAKSYSKDVQDEFVLPCNIEINGKFVTVDSKDSVVFFNFRPDRAREITRAFCDEAFEGFERSKGKLDLTYICFTEYDATIPNKEVLFEKETYINTLGEYISNLGKKQLRIAETEKYAHVTFFFNGGVEKPYENEDRVLIKSPDVATYDLKPDMSLFEVTKQLKERILSNEYDLIICNFANPDMVGHTGNMKAATLAIEAVDKALEITTNAIKEANGRLFICADHGNADKMVDETTGEVFTAHTTNPVPFVLFNCEDDGVIGLKDGRLCDIAPTLLELMEIEKPKEMTGESLLEKN